MYWVCSVCGYEDTENESNDSKLLCPMCSSHCSFIDVAHSIPASLYGGEGHPDRRLIRHIGLHAHAY